MGGAFSAEFHPRRRPWHPEMGIPLMDRVRFGEVYLPAWVNRERLVPTEGRFLNPIRTKLDQAEMIEASGACELFYTGRDEEYWDFERDLPRFALPFPLFWIEMKKPSRIVSRLTGIHSTKGLPDRTGFLFQRLPLQRGRQALGQMRLPPFMELQGKLAATLEHARHQSSRSRRNMAGPPGSTSPMKNVHSPRSFVTIGKTKKSRKCSSTYPRPRAHVESTCFCRLVMRRSDPWEAGSC